MVVSGSRHSLGVLDSVSHGWGRLLCLNTQSTVLPLLASGDQGVWLSWGFLLGNNKDDVNKHNSEKSKFCTNYKMI